MRRSWMFNVAGIILKLAVPIVNPTRLHMYINIWNVFSNLFTILSICIKIKLVWQGWNGWACKEYENIVLCAHDCVQLFVRLKRPQQIKSQDPTSCAACSCSLPAGWHRTAKAGRIKSSLSKCSQILMRKLWLNLMGCSK